MPLTQGAQLETVRLEERADVQEGSSSQSPNPPSPASNKQPEKPKPRRRAVGTAGHIACDFCRQRKLRCTGAKPKCKACEDRAQECSYVPNLRRRGPGKNRGSNRRNLRDETGERESTPPQYSALRWPEATSRRALTPAARDRPDMSSTPALGAARRTDDALSRSSPPKNPMNGDSFRTIHNFAGGDPHANSASDVEPSANHQPASSMKRQP
ncbi:hypothetical protein BD626DRAFT_493530 [Schizophyllum amplum]|uniref:Zn(2)-C6 fungal-type domain-containing protein n=1 Tax=Schizophyllum amplum TaxID=97359 RepID=A0A550CGX2_9AGAR|nr:hypothetical protein BD626DRAFT_493530 [Auriculariopsis ampla]